MFKIGLSELRYQNHKDNLGSVGLKFIQHNFLDTSSVQFCVCICLHSSSNIFEACKNLGVNIHIEVALKT